MAPFGPWPGEGNGTLSKVYAAGASDPSVNDLMGMALGTTLRFQANTNGSNLPLVGAFETEDSVPLVSSGIPANVVSLVTVNGTFGRVFNGLQQFDTSWDGTFLSIGDRGIFTVEEASFLNAAQTFWQGGLILASRDYNPTGRAPEGSPGGGPSAGSMVHEVNLYNSLGNNVPVIEQLDGWGQHRGILFPIASGITWWRSIHWQSGFAGGTIAGDGTGIAIFESPLNHDGGDNKRAALTAAALDDVGNWKWSFLVNDGTDNWVDVADFAKESATLSSTTASITTQLLVGGPTTDPLGTGNTIVGAFTNQDNGTINELIANESRGTSASTNLFFLAGSFDGSVGANSTFTLNGPNFANAVLGGPQAFLFAHIPNIGAPIIFWNETNIDGADIVFKVGPNIEVMRFLHAGGVVQFGINGTVAPGATAVTITNSPGASANPVEYAVVKNSLGQTRYIPLLA